MRFEAFQAFIQRRKADFSRIARATRNRLSPEELKNEAWIMAHEIGERRQRQINFGDEQDQQLILGALNIEHVKRNGKSVRYAVSIDQSYDGEDGEVNPWANKLLAEETADPILSLIRSEAAIDEAALLVRSYSQASAYVVTCVHFKNNRQAICEYLVISLATLRNRMRTVANSVRVQASLFDGMERISDNFMPLRGRLYQNARTCTHPDIPQQNYVLFS